MSRPVIHRIGVAPLLALGLLIGLAVPASASSVERTVLVETGVSVEETCGTDWSVSTDSRTVITLKAGSHGDPTPKFSASSHYRSVYTDPGDPDRGFILSGNELFKDRHVTRIGGTTYEFESMEVGRETISTLGGRMIAADQGRISWRFVVDTHGSADPGDELLEGTITGVSEPHPILESGDEGCEMILDAIG